ncbi:formate dehydrogenase accessory sulfurtransferase FdhD [Zhihengliuella halotolerans]|uniref:Sulfur carrier protein FdhD n=1 Tax=Zhihengliuella halotolerans TaxID=370736 RepID=A0A4Q8AAT1_9MICC|nr:formate dehydrogenase accessory sulfurtransferase FdhD [Zhihengliuella halotolerans]RZU60609.1 FdhD protein [Zhihengliuella halotolerans]
MGRKTTRRRIVRLSADGAERRREETLAAEEPLEIRLGIPGVPGSAETAFTVTMRTPGDDFDLVAGFLTGEGVIASADDLVSMRFCAGEDEEGRQTFNVVEAQLGPGAHPPTSGMRRNVTTTSACGICGTASIDAVGKSARLPLASTACAGHDDGARVPLDVLLALPDTLREHQELFSKTGGVHAAGLFDSVGNLLCLREDVGRHNAVDKVVGWALREGRLPAAGTVMQVSGRASFELVQKTRMAGIGVLSAVSAPSSLAVELAEKENVTLAAFSRGSSVNVYTHPERIATRRNDA